MSEYMINRLGRRDFLAAAIGSAGAISMPAWGRTRNFFARHGLPVGVQIYAVDELVKKDLPGTLDRLAGIGFKTIELAGLHGYTPRQLRDAADGAGLRIGSIHLNDTQLGTTDEDAKRMAADLAVLGTSDVVMPMFIFPRDVARENGETFAYYLYRAAASKGVDLWKRTADFLNERAAVLASQGLRLAYHNHNIEFEPVDGTTGWEILCERTDPKLVSFEIDAGWVAAAGIDPVAFVSRHAGRVRQMHVKDILATTHANFAFRQDPAEVGSGMIDWNALLPAAYKAGVTQFYVEQEPPFRIDRFVSLEKSFSYLTT